MANSTFLTLNSYGDPVAALQTALDRLGYSIANEEVKEKHFGTSTQSALLDFQHKHGLHPSGVYDEATQALVAKAIAVLEANQRLVEGRIFLDNGLPASGFTLRLYHIGFGGTGEQLGEIKADDQGYYSIKYLTQDKPFNLEIRGVKPSQGRRNPEEIALSVIKYNAEPYEVMNLVAPTDPFTQISASNSEYKHLTDDLHRQIGRKSLKTAEEKEARRDLTLLHQATGWDARLIALAAIAEQRKADIDLPVEVLYALFRVGLPSDLDKLALVSVEIIETALKKAGDAGIIHLTDDLLATTKEKFAAFLSSKRPALRALGALSSFGELLDKSVIHDNANARTAFETAYFNDQGSTADLWTRAAEAGVSDEAIRKLQVQGKLAYLTFNNAVLTETLQTVVESSEQFSRLVGFGANADHDFYKADTWKQRLQTLANNDEAALKALIPPAYEGDLDFYTADMARRIRISFPTQVVARMVETQELSLPDSPPDLTQSVATFLHQAAAQGFQLGHIPIESFIQEHAAFQNVDPALIDRVNLLHRLYQITPSNEALQALLSHELTSAHEVTAFSYDRFMNLVGPAFRSAEEATLTYLKAQQVQHTIAEVALLAQQSKSSAAPALISGGIEQAQQEKDALLKKFPTLESLFGSMDFCECEHCQSVLSPAAYFVDLLHFLDPSAGFKSTAWTEFIQEWRRTHLNIPYPFSDESAWETFIAAWQKDFPGTPDPETEKTPYEILNLRRPDLSYLPLTCENTHTVLPYIDVVNEILEFYVAHERLTQAAAHDTGDATTAELLAEPQNIEVSAYDTLKQAHYPLALPFDLWLETVRQFLNQFKTPLWQVLDTFRPTDQLFDATKSYDRAAIFREYLGLSPTEYAIFADSDIYLDPLKWYELYGYSSSREATIHLPTAKTLARRLDISYKDLVKMVMTSFVNPELDALSIIWKLHLDVGDVWQYLENKDKPTYQDEATAFEARLEQLVQETSSQFTQGDILNYFQGLKDAGAFRRTLVLKDEALTQCDFAKTHLEFADSQNNSVTEIVFLKINLFVRLWKKLGWTMDELDRALQVFLPIPSQNLQGNNIGNAFKTALVYLAHLQTLNETLKVGKDSRQKLLTLWADLPTTGKKPLYAQLFLTRSVLKNDAIFDHPLGYYLQYFDEGEKTFKPFRWEKEHLQEEPKAGYVALKKHLMAVQGALNLTTREIYSILADAGLDLESTALNLMTVSLLYRYGLLAKALQFSIRELIDLKQLSGLNPFKPIHNNRLQDLDLETDYPYTQTLRFVEIAQTVKASGFKVEDLTYLFQHRFDPVGKYRPDTKALNTLLETLKTGIQKIQTDYPIPTDPVLITDEMLREKLSLVLSPKEVDTFFGFWNDTLEFSAELENVSEDQKLSPSTYNTGQLRVSYNKELKLQRVTHQGVLTGDINQYLTDTLKIQNPDARIVELLRTIAKKALDQRQSFFDTCFKKQGQMLLSYNDLFGGAVLTLAPAAKRQVLVNAFWPFLIQQLTAQLITQTLATTLSAEPALVQALLTKPQLLHDPNQPQTPLLEIFSAVDQTGAKADFFTTADAIGNPQQTRIVPAITTTVKPLDVQSARFEGYLQVPVGGNYQLIAVCEQPGIAVKLEFDHLKRQPPVIVIQGTALRKGAELSGTVSDLEAKTTYRYTLEAKNLPNQGNLTLRIQHAQLPQGSQAQILLQPQDPEAVIQGVDRAYKLLTKTVQILQGLSLSQREIGHFSNYKGDFGDLDLSQLPTDPLDLTNQQAKELAQKLFGQWLRLVDYARLKRDLSEDTDDLINILDIAQQIKASADASQTGNPSTSLIQAFAQAIADLTRRDRNLVSRWT